jgi:flavodoxin I
MATAIFYASSTGNTEDIAKKIAEELGGVEIFDITDTQVKKINEFDKLIFGTATWGEGELEDEWEDVMDEFSKIDLSGKTVALFGLGDQESYSDTYLDAMGIMYEKVLKMGANVIGSLDVDDDFDFDSSKAVVNDKFVGLALDEDNQSELSEKRIKTWISQIKSQIL